MYLSQITLDKRIVRQPYQWHRVLWSLFPSRPTAQRDFLFRLEEQTSSGDRLLLMQSAIMPHTSDYASVIATKPYALRLSTGMQLRFKLRANPVKTIRDSAGRLNGKGEIKSCRVPLLYADQQIDWLQRKLTTAAILNDVIAASEPPIWFSKKGSGNGKINPVMFSGAITLKNVEAFNLLLKGGVGAAKSFGCGLLSIRR